MDSLLYTPRKPILVTENFFSNVQSSTTQDVEQAVESEMRCHAYGNTNDLVSSLFGTKHLKDITTRVLDSLIKRGVYVPASGGIEGHWANLPLNPPVEDVLYEPLTAILNEITKEVGDDGLPIEWQDVHSKAPQSDFMAELRPDIIATFKDCLKDVDNPRVWWRIIHTLIEVKKKAEALPAAMQLLRYLRQTLREQPDRRFIYGMVFSKINLTLWHADRTGALASQLINIHKDPTSFVLVIVGLLASKPVDLGWDPTMKRYIMDRNTGAYKKLPSYEVDAQTNMDADDPYGRMWVVTMSQARSPPSTPTGLDDSLTQAADSETLSSGEEGSSTEPELAESQEFDEEEFVLFHALSLARAEVIRGRATRIWKAWRMVDMAMPAKERPVFVFKDAWRDQRRGLEGDLYAHAGKDGHGVARVYSYGEVRINGHVDDTLHMIRKGVKGQGKPLNLKTAQPKPKTVDPTHEDTYRLPSSGHFDEWSQDRFENEVDTRIERVQCNRIHSRLVMASFGHPLTKFANLLELLAALHDAIAGHQWLYENGILHRDISIGNILITGLEDSNRGILIDLDYAIKHFKYESLWDDERSGTIAFMSYEVLMHERYDFQAIASAKLQLKEPSSDDEEEPEAVSLPGPPDLVKHDAVHDLESFFWVLCWICMAREGPAKPRVFNPTEMTPPRQWLIKIFEQRNSTNLALQKKEIISSPKKFKSRILDSFSPYFKPLAPLVDALYRELRIAYMTGEFKGLHQTFLDSLKKVMEWKTIQKWHLTEKAYEAMETMERARRQLDSALWDSPKRK
ncbi:hypothetical protein EWM64_g5356 [Hericium alpestre]|uniref:Fungal-type protein kinase domain-containing protein n=1 Tax=Hericium alpestre TaxID=135208 RepID=A0A4Y9ZZ23_9AGAM|nr:hypothetical protein EWM64_g5356 [Hericium alpestre]